MSQRIRQSIVVFLPVAAAFVFVAEIARRWG
jgi:hypothetical protein